MPLSDTAASLLEHAAIAPEVRELRPDYRALLVTVEGIVPGASDQRSEELLERAEAWAATALEGAAAEELPHIGAWRDAYRAFGAKPQRTRNSLEALTRRAPQGLPRVNRLTDVSNALSVLRQIPFGGERLDAYEGAPRLVRATGEEGFATMAGGEDALEHPEPGEVVWRDDAGVTCRRWNWRQCRRTALEEGTTAALFILDALAPVDDGALAQAADELVAEIARFSPRLAAGQRILGGGA